MDAVDAETVPYSTKTSSNSHQTQPSNLNSKVKVSSRSGIQPSLSKDFREEDFRGGEACAKEYRQFLRLIWMTSAVPTERKDMNVSPIIKKSASAIPKDTRPVKYLATLTKMLNSIIAERNRNKYEEKLHEAMYAYRESCSTWTAIGHLFSLILIRRKCVVAFLHMSKAFDRVSRRAFERAL